MSTRPASTPGPAGAGLHGSGLDQTAESPALDEPRTENSIILQCGWCGEVADKPAPAGWVVATRCLTGLVRSGVCPKCVLTHFTFTPSGSTG